MMGSNRNLLFQGFSGAMLVSGRVIPPKKWQLNKHPPGDSSRDLFIRTSWLEVTFLLWVRDTWTHHPKKVTIAELPGRLSSLASLQNKGDVLTACYKKTGEKKKETSCLHEAPCHFSRGKRCNVSFKPQGIDPLGFFARKIGQACHSMWRNKNELPYGYYLPRKLTWVAGKSPCSIRNMYIHIFKMVDLSIVMLVFGKAIWFVYATLFEPVQGLLSIAQMYVNQPSISMGYSRDCSHWNCISFVYIPGSTYDRGGNRKPLCFNKGSTHSSFKRTLISTLPARFNS